jgi:hypothetical protein
MDGKTLITTFRRPLIFHFGCYVTKNVDIVIIKLNATIKILSNSSILRGAIHVHRQSASE